MRLTTSIKLIAIIILVFSLNSTSQTLDPYKSLRRGYMLNNYPNLVNYNKIHTDSVPYYFDDFLKFLNKKDKNYGYGIYQVAIYFFEKNNFAKADSLYQIFLNLNHPKEYDEILYNGDEGVVPNNLFFFVYNDLCEINLKRNNYKLALKYICLSEKSPFEHFCGNAEPSRSAFTAYTKAKCYLGLNKQNSALMELLPYIFDQETEDYDNIIAQASQLLKNKYKDKTKEIVESAFENIAVEEDKYEGTIYHSYYIKIDGILIYVHRIYPTGDENETDSKKYLWNSDFYNMIKN